MCVDSKQEIFLKLTLISITNLLVESFSKILTSYLREKLMYSPSNGIGYVRLQL